MHVLPHAFPVWQMRQHLIGGMQAFRSCEGDAGTPSQIPAMQSAATSDLAIDEMIAALDARASVTCGARLAPCGDMESRIAVTVLLLACACGGSREVSRPAQTTLTSGETQPSKLPETRTVDATGFVDNSGRTSEEVARPETSGARATETSSDRPTGTNTGVPNGARTGTGPEQPLVPSAGALKPVGGISPVAGYGDEPGKMGRAVCDHEKVCDHIGVGKAFESDAACESAVRARAIVDLDKMACRLDSSAVAVCLAELRRAPCNRVIDRAASLEACADHSLCVR